MKRVSVDTPCLKIVGVLSTPGTSTYNTTVDFILHALEREVDRFTSFTDDSYNFGKQVAREARFVLTAHRFNFTRIKNKCLEKIQTQLQRWWHTVNHTLLSSETQRTNNYFVYDTTYKGLVTAQGLIDMNKDFGNGYYNDHHVR